MNSADLGTGTVYWYDADAAKAILSHTDALILNEQDGMLAAADASAVAAPLQ